MAMNVDQFCGILHHVYARAFPNLHPESWLDLPEDQKDAMRLAIAALADVVRREERALIREEFMRCVDDFTLNVRPEQV